MGLVRLTPKQEKFSLLVASGATYSDAYKGAYDAENMLQTTIWQEASKLMDNPKVAERIKELAEHREKSFLQADAKRLRVHVLENLLKESVDKNNKGSERIKALELIGKTDIVSMFKERVEQETVHVNDVEALEAQLKEKLANMLGMSAVDVTPRQVGDDRAKK